LERQHIDGSISKLFLQTNSALQLSQGTIIELADITIKKVDYVSMQNIARSVLETYAVIHHIFISPGIENAIKKDDIKKFRLLYSKYQGLIIRKDLPPQDEAQKAQLQNEAIEIKQSLDDIRNTQHYADLKAKAKNKIRFDSDLEAGIYNELSKNRMLKNSGISAKTVKILYGYLSNHSHSGYLSLVQTGWSSDSNKAKIALEHCFRAMLLTIMALEEIFPEVRKILDENPTEKEAIKTLSDEYRNVLG
jgi:hypothetical protein